ncbi:hypothetical protein KPC83_00925 [Collinsella sp. zg1085]|uniref:RDAC family protein n=1 Tax=Collinsella sp. zg1085 TaxID=2844380 RepID=UPI001C0AD56E|nr:hypothetical protein [Collinsella sp. zg1085]QWT17758.1 hypothetical protein KPC83_00925 [Collinsella sp. zg1085]
MRAIITPFQVADLNTHLAHEQIAVKVHLTDACGAQSLWLEGDASQFAAAEASITNFLADIRLTPQFSDDKSRFTLV